MTSNIKDVKLVIKASCGFSQSRPFENSRKLTAKIIVFTSPVMFYTAEIINAFKKPHICIQSHIRL